MAVYIIYTEDGKIESILGESALIEFDRILKKLIEYKYGTED